jgi:hypothetical protein
VKKKKKLNFLKAKKRRIVRTKNKKKRADLFLLKKNISPKSIKIQMNMIIISIKIRNMISMRRNMSQSQPKKLTMILILKKESKTTDCHLQDILLNNSSEEHQLIQEDLQLVSEANSHLKE